MPWHRHSIRAGLLRLHGRLCSGLGVPFPGCRLPAAGWKDGHPLFQGLRTRPSWPCRVYPHPHRKGDLMTVLRMALGVFLGLVVLGMLVKLLPLVMLALMALGVVYGEAGGETPPGTDAATSPSVPQHRRRGCQHSFCPRLLAGAPTTPKRHRPAGRWRKTS